MISPPDREAKVYWVCADCLRPDEEDHALPPQREEDFWAEVKARRSREKIRKANRPDAAGVMPHVPHVRISGLLDGHEVWVEWSEGAIGGDPALLARIEQAFDEGRVVSGDPLPTPYDLADATIEDDPHGFRAAAVAALSDLGLPHREIRVEAEGLPPLPPSPSGVDH